MAWLWGGSASHPPSTYPVKDVLKAVWVGDIEAEEQDTGVRVEEGPQAVIIDLSCRTGVVTPSRRPAHCQRLPDIKPWILLKRAHMCACVLCV